MAVSDRNGITDPGTAAGAMRAQQASRGRVNATHDSQLLNRGKAKEGTRVGGTKKTKDQQGDRTRKVDAATAMRDQAASRGRANAAHDSQLMNRGKAKEGTRVGGTEKTKDQKRDRTDKIDAAEAERRRAEQRARVEKEKRQSGETPEQRKARQEQEKETAAQQEAQRKAAAQKQAERKPPPQPTPNTPPPPKAPPPKESEPPEPQPTPEQPKSTATTYRPHNAGMTEARIAGAEVAFESAMSLFS